MIKSKSIRIREIGSNNYVDDMVLRPSEEAKICLNCTLPDCTKNLRCNRYRKEKLKLKKEREQHDAATEKDD